MDKQLVLKTFMNERKIRGNFWIGLTALLAALLAVILAGIALYRTNNSLSYYFRAWSYSRGDTTIWEDKNDSIHISLYFSNKPTIPTDIKWDGQYPTGYFND